MMEAVSCNTNIQLLTTEKLVIHVIPKNVIL